MCVCLYVTDSLCYTAEINTTCKSTILNEKINFKNAAIYLAEVLCVPVKIIWNQRESRTRCWWGAHGPQWAILPANIWGQVCVPCTPARHREVSLPGEVDPYRDVVSVCLQWEPQQVTQRPLIRPAFWIQQFPSDHLILRWDHFCFSDSAFVVVDWNYYHIVCFITGF